MPLTIPPTTYASQIGFTSVYGLVSTDANSAIDEVYSKSTKLATDNTLSGKLSLSDSTPSNSVSTGALVVAGGIGVGGNSFINTLRITSNTNASNTTSGALVSTGGIGIGGTSYINTLRVSGGSASTSSTNGALVVTGGVGIGGNLNLGASLSADNLPKVFASRSTNTSAINQSTTTKITFNSEEKDNQNIYSTTNGNSTIPTAYPGNYELKFYVDTTFSNDASQACRVIISLYKNNLFYKDIGAGISAISSTVAARASGSIDLFDLVAGDILDLRITGFSNNGATFTVNSGSWFSLCKTL